jgi:hypothetical protein
MALGMNVPLGSLAVGGGACLLLGSQPAIWLAAGAVGLAGIAGATALALRQGPSGGRVPPRAFDSKPAFDPEAFDAVGR